MWLDYSTLFDVWS